jgi:hypothetical protein
MAATPSIVRAEFLNVDGSVIGTAAIRINTREYREAIRDTIGAGFTVDIPVSPIGDKRCPYQLRFSVDGVWPHDGG